MKAFSVPHNWRRLIIVNSNPDIERLRGIQGCKFYSMLMVISAHTIYIFISLPISNIKEIETVK